MTRVGSTFDADPFGGSIVETEVVIGQGDMGEGKLYRSRSERDLRAER